MLSAQFPETAVSQSLCIENIPQKHTCTRILVCSVAPILPVGEASVVSGTGVIGGRWLPSPGAPLAAPPGPSLRARLCPGRAGVAFGSVLGEAAGTRSAVSSGLGPDPCPQWTSCDALPGRVTSGQCFCGPPPGRPPPGHHKRVSPRAYL